MSGPYDASKKSSNQLRQDAANAREERSTISGNSDRDTQDRHDFDHAGTVFTEATRELKRRGE